MSEYGWLISIVSSTLIAVTIVAALVILDKIG